MIIKCDEEGKNAIMSMLDVCLKSGGIGNREAVNKVFDCLQDESPEIDPTEDESPEETTEEGDHT